MQRCQWVTSDPLYLTYHDKEWGRPNKDRRYLFEKLCLEGQMAGLSWLTILKKRENYRQLFYHFDPQAVSLMTEADAERLMQNPGIIRNRAKINAIITNARACLAMEAAGEPLADFLWNFVDHQPQIEHFSQQSEIPVTTPLSDEMSKALKKRGFKFIGSTTCMSLMQACGLVNHHLTGCFCHPDNQEET